MDTNSDPEGIDFPIPGNDDARRSIDLYCSLLKETIHNAKKDRSESLNENQTEKVVDNKIEITDIKNSEKIKTEKKTN